MPKRNKLVLAKALREAFESVERRWKPRLVREVHNGKAKNFSVQPLTLKQATAMIEASIKNGYSRTGMEEKIVEAAA